MASDLEQNAENKVWKNYIKWRKWQLALAIRAGKPFLEKYVISVYLWCIKGKSPWSKFPECKQMISDEAFSNDYCLFIFFIFPYLPNMEIIISSRLRMVKWWIPRKTRYFYVFDCSTMSTIYADSRMEVRRYRFMDII